MRIVAFFMLSIIVCGCYRSELKESLSVDPFFDLKGYMESQIDSLREQQDPVEKTITLGDKSETHRFSDFDYDRELTIFLQSDINKPAWFDKYRIDSVQQNGRLQAVTYTALDTSLRTRELRVELDGPAVERIYLRNRTKTVLSSGDQELWYEPGRGYRIATLQKSLASDPLESVIEVEF